MDYEKERLKINLMGYTVKTVRTCNEYYSMVVSCESAAETHPELCSSPFLDKGESIQHAIDLFLRFHKLMKKYGY